MKILLIISVLLAVNSINADEESKQNQHDYCSGYLSEVYGALDAIEDSVTKLKVENFFNENFEDAKQLNYNLYYDINIGKFIINYQKQDLTKYQKTNYPNFEIIILHSYINYFLLDSPHGNFCPSFGDDCSESSFKSYFNAAEDFSKNWNSHDSPYDFLHNEFKNNQ